MMRRVNGKNILKRRVLERREKREGSSNGANCVAGKAESIVLQIRPGWRTRRVRDRLASFEWVRLQAIPLSAKLSSQNSHLSKFNLSIS